MAAMRVGEMSVGAVFLPIDPEFDVWVWITCLVLLAVLGTRAWLVETGRSGGGRTPVKVRALTGAAVTLVVVVAGLVAMQGGVNLATAVLTGVDPAESVPGGAPGLVGDPAPVGGPPPPVAPPAAGGPAPPPGR